MLAGEELDAMLHAAYHLGHPCRREESGAYVIQRAV
jgi:hypothetical protein